MSGERAFVTGATGVTGGRLCEVLVARGRKVTALVRETARRKERAVALERLRVELVTGDLRDAGSWAGALAGADVVYHIAAAFREARLSDRDYTEVNVHGTRHVIEAAAAAGVRRVVHCSTVGVHGDTGRTPANEDTPFSPPDFYCQSKLEGELLARELCAKLGLEGVVFRPVGIYGASDDRFLKLFRGVARGRFVMIGSGDILYHLTFIDDLCDGIQLCGEKPEASGGVFILGGEEYVTLNQLVDEVARATGGRRFPFRVPMAPVMAAATLCEKVCRPLGIEPPLYPRRVEFFSKHRAFDISRAKRVLGYQPKVPLRDGLARTAAGYREQGLL